MKIAYFPKNDDEATLFSREFNHQGIDFDVYKPSDVYLGYDILPSAGAGPFLEIKDLADPKSRNIPFIDFDLVFQRSVSYWGQIYGLEIVRFFFETLELVSDHVRILNPPRSTLNARRKHVALSLLARENIPVPTFFASPSPIRNMIITREIKPPLMLKSLEGAGGIGVLLAPDKQVAGDVFSLFYKNRHVPIIEPYMEVDHDFRVFVLGGEVLGCIKRTSKLHKHNISLGAKASYVPIKDIPSDVIEFSLRATDVLSVPIAGVDVIPASCGPLVLEVNPSPGFEGLSRASGKNIPREIVKFLVKFSKS